MPPGLTSIACLRCTRQFERRRANGRFCPDCRRERDNERRVERRREQQRALDDDRALVANVAENLRPYLTPDMWVTVEDYLDALGIDPKRDPAPIVDDRQPAGTLSHEGSDDGMTTGWKDLQADLDERRMRVIMHDWFREHPHWTNGLIGEAAT